MSEPAVRLPRVSKGKRPQFFNDPAIDQMMTFIIELSAEVSVLYDRVDTVERLLESKGTVSRADIENYRAPEAVEAERANRRDGYLKRVFRMHPPQPVKISASKPTATPAPKAKKQKPKAKTKPKSKPKQKPRSAAKPVRAVETLVQHVASTTYGDLPATAIKSAKIFIYDTFACALAGTTGPATSDVLNAAKLWGTGDEASVWGQDVRLPAPVPRW